MTTTSHQLSLEYIAGFFDGEGCIRISANAADRGMGIHVFITNTYSPILHQICQQFGGKVSLRNKAEPNHRTCYQWRISNRKQALCFLKSILPYLVEKKPQAVLGIEFCELPDLHASGWYVSSPEVLSRKQAIKQELSRLKKIDYAPQEMPNG